MKKILLIGIGTILLLAVALGLYFGSKQAPNAAPTDTLIESPFGTPNSDLPAAQPGFEGEVPPLEELQANGSQDTLKLFKIESSPVAGFVALTRGSTTSIRYAERATGHISEAKLPEIEKKRLTNETLPKIYEAYFRPDGTAVLYRTLHDGDSVKNMSLALTAPRATSTEEFWKITMTLLRGTLDSFSVGRGDTLFYVIDDSHAVVSSTFAGTGVKTLASGPISPWRTAPWGTSALIFSKPSSRLPGYAYTFAGSSLTKVLGPLNGLVVTPNPAGTHLLYSYVSGNTTSLAIATGSGTRSDFTPATLADKCVGSSAERGVFYCGAPQGGISESEPDNWYQGKTSFSDEVWRFDAGTEGAELILSPESSFGISLDIMKPALSPDERYLVFINKKDLSLWAIRLK